MADAPVALITGGAQGIGAAMTGVLLKKGYKVCVSDIKEEKGKHFVKEQEEKHGNDNVKFVICDVTKEEDYKALFDFTLKEFKKIDLVINNAGIMLEQNPRKCLDVNLMGPILGCQYALQYMGKSNGGRGGMVINTASIASFAPSYVSPVYVASKHGVLGLTRSYGTDYHLEREGVIFAAICPSFTDTEILQHISTTSLVADDPFKGRKLLTPEYVAGGLLKLLEDKINGSALLVTHGYGYKYIELQEEFSDKTKL